MIIYRKYFSGYSGTPINGASYYPGKLLNNTVLNPIDKTLTKINNTPIGKIKPLNKKLERVKNIVKPIKKLINKNNK